MKRKLIELDTISLKQKIALALVLLILLIVGTSIMGTFSKNRNKILEYGKINSSQIIENGVETKDRNAYWILNDIIVWFFQSYQQEIGMVTEDHYTTKQFYDTLDPVYKDYLGKDKYYEVAKTMLNKFIYTTQQSSFVKTTNLIKSIYLLEGSTDKEKRYFCELYPEDKNTKSYIGIKLNTESKVFNIFYLE